MREEAAECGLTFQIYGKHMVNTFLSFHMHSVSKLLRHACYSGINPQNEASMAKGNIYYI